MVIPVPGTSAKDPASKAAKKQPAAKAAKAGGASGASAARSSTRSPRKKHSAWSPQYPGRDLARLQELCAKAQQLAALTDKQVLEKLAKIAVNLAEAKHPDADWLRKLAAVWLDRAGKGIGGVDDSTAVHSGELEEGDDELDWEADIDTEVCAEGKAAAESIDRALNAVLTHEELGGKDGECGCLSVVVGGARGGRVEVRTPQPQGAG